ncbi:lysosomal-associated transmembrane protein 5 [Hyperolius riggenbachi]|uniref:lysosomal-associated transmembrane protein 5 n=1 Tax=Hyperolius riggenbachi TaxID=752182 RepID=UPI0035A36401
MAAKKIEASASSSGSIRAVAHVLAIYHLVLSIILFIEYSVELAKRKNCCLEISNYIRLDIISSYLLLLVLLLISISMLWGIVVNRGYLVIPFLALQMMDFILSLLMFCSVYSEKPFNQMTAIEDNLALTDPNTQGPAWKSFEMCLRLMTFCSCYVEVPTYLEIKSVSYMSYFTVNSLPYKKYSTRLIIFTLLHITVFLYKALMIWCIWKVFKSLNPSTKKKDKPQLQDFSKVALPSYEEAVKVSKESPPPYSTV